MQYEHFNWFERGWNSTLGLPEQLVRRMFRVTTKGINPFSEEGFGDASLIPILGALDSKRKDVKDPEFLSSINQTFGTQLNPEGFAPALFTSLLTDPLSWLSGGASTLAKQSMAVNRLRRSDALKAFDFSGGTADEVITAAEKALEGGKLSDDQVEYLTKQLRRSKDIDRSKTLRELRQAESDRRLVVALPFMERFESARIATLKPEHQSWTRLAWDATTKNEGAKFLGAATRSLVGFASEVPALGHVLHYLADSAHAITLSRASLATKQGFRLDRAMPGLEGEALHEFASANEATFNRLITRGAGNVLERVGKLEQRQAKYRAMAQDSTLSASQRSRAKKLADKYDTVSREEMLLQGFGVNTAKLTRQQVMEQGQKLWNDLNFGKETALWTDPFALRDTLKRFQGDVGEANQRLRDSFMERVQTEAGDAVAQAEGLNKLGQATYTLARTGRNLYRRVFKTDTKIGFEDWLESEKTLRTQVASATTAVEQRAAVIGDLMVRTADENGMAPEVLDSIVLSMMEVSAHDDEIEGVLRLALAGNRKEYLRTVANHIQRSTSSIDRMTELLRNAGHGALADELDEVGFAHLNRRGIGAEYAESSRRKYQQAQGKPRLRFGDPISYTLPDGRQLGYLDNNQLGQARQRLDKVRQYDEKLARKLQRMPGVGPETTKVRKELQPMTKAQLLDYARRNRLKLPATSRMRKAELAEAIEVAALQREAKRVKVDPELLGAASTSDELQSVLRLAKARQTREGKSLLDEMAGLEGDLLETDLAEDAIDRLLHMRERGYGKQVEYKPQRFAEPEVPERAALKEGAAQPTYPNLLEEGGVVLSEAEAGSVQASLFRLVTLRDELARVSDPDPLLLKELAESQKAVSRFIEDKMRAHFRTAGKSGELLLDTLRETSTEVFNANYRAGLIREGSPLGYVGRFLNGSQRQALNDLIDEIPGELKDQLAPQLSSAFGRSADNMTVHELNEMHRELQKLAPDKKYGEGIRKTLEDAGVSTDKFVESAQLSVLGAFAQAQRREVTADFMDDVIGSGMEDGIHKLKGFEVVGLVNTIDNTQVMPKGKALRRTTSALPEGGERVVSTIEETQDFAKFDALLLRDADGKQITVHFNQFGQDTTKLSLQPIGAHGDDISMGQAVALSTTSQIGKDFNSMLRNSITAEGAQELVGQRVLVGSKEILHEAHDMVTSQFKNQNQFWALYDEAHTMIKGLQTVWRPDFHVANFASSLFQMSLTDGVRANHMVGGLMDVFRVLFADEENIATSIDTAAELLSPSKGIRSLIKQNAKLARRVERRGVLGGVPKQVDRLENLPWADLQDLAKEFGVKGRSKSELIDGIRKTTGGKLDINTGRVTEGAAYRGQTANFVQIGDQSFDIEELVDAMAAQGMLSTYIREGLRGSSSITDTLQRLRDKAFGKGMTAEMVGKKGAKAARETLESIREFQEFSETVVRFTSMFSMIRAGYSPETAAKLTKRWMVDYNDLTRIERNVAKRMFSFYTFPRKFIPAAIRALDKDPSKVGHMSAWVQAGINDGTIDTSEGRLVLNLSEDKKADLARLNAPLEAMIFLPRLLAAADVAVPGGEEPVVSRLSGAPGLAEASAIFRVGSLFDAAKLFTDDPEIDDPSVFQELANITPLTKWLTTRWAAGTLTGRADISRGYLEEAAFQLLPFREVSENHFEKRLEARLLQAQQLIQGNLLEAQERGDQAKTQYWNDVYNQTDELVMSYLRKPRSTVAEKL